jgi:hypothetical protein
MVATIDRVGAMGDKDHHIQSHIHNLPTNQIEWVKPTVGIILIMKMIGDAIMKTIQDLPGNDRHIQSHIHHLRTNQIEWIDLTVVIILIKEMIGDAMMETTLCLQGKDHLIRNHIHHLATNLTEVIHRTVGTTHTRVMIGDDMVIRIIIPGMQIMPTDPLPTITNLEDQIGLIEMRTLLKGTADIRWREIGSIIQRAEIGFPMMMSSLTR